MPLCNNICLEIKNFIGSNHNFSKHRLPEYQKSQHIFCTHKILFECLHLCIGYKFSQSKDDSTYSCIDLFIIKIYVSLIKIHPCHIKVIIDQNVFNSFINSHLELTPIKKTIKYWVVDEEFLLCSVSSLAVFPFNHTWFSHSTATLKYESNKKNWFSNILDCDIPQRISRRSPFIALNICKSTLWCRFEIQGKKFKSRIVVPQGHFSCVNCWRWNREPSSTSHIPIHISG